MKKLAQPDCDPREAVTEERPRKPINLMDVSFFGTILFFFLSLVHISFSLFGLICAVTPFILHGYHRDKRWCKSVCPRASLFTKLFSRISLGLRAPRGLLGKGGRNAILIWFLVNFSIAVLTTIAVGSGRIDPLSHVRFLLAFRMPFDLPQLLQFSVSPALEHFGYRIFSLMFTSTTIGLVFGLLFSPRSWCAICPISTLTPMPKKALPSR